MNKNQKFEYHFCQPWIEALGHPLSSTIKLYKLTEQNPYCKIFCQGSTKLNELPDSKKIKKYKLYKFQRNIHISTLIFFFNHLKDLINKGEKSLIKIFYLDSSPILLITLTIIFSPLLKSLKIDCVSTVMLSNPEKYIKNNFFKFLIEILSSSMVKVKLFSRTELINDVYHKNFPKHKKNFILLPMLELTQSKETNITRASNKIISFGVFGQIRNGKCITELIDYFSKNGNYRLIIAGKSWLNGIDNIKQNISENISLIDAFLSNDDLHILASKVDYHLLLYSSPWDIRMESGNYYLALEHLKPVITFRKGWIGNQVKKIKNGIIIEDFSEFKSLLKKPELKTIDNNVYKKMQLNGKNYIKNNYPHKIIDELFAKL